MDTEKAKDATDNITKWKNAALRLTQILAKLPLEALGDEDLTYAEEKIASLILPHSKMFGGPKLPSMKTIPAPQTDVSYQTACSIATYLREHWFADSIPFKLLPDLDGVLSQISNMVAGLHQPAETPLTGEQWREACYIAIRDVGKGVIDPMEVIIDAQIIIDELTEARARELLGLGEDNG